MNLPDELVLSTGLFQDHPIRDDASSEKWLQSADATIQLIKELRSRISDGSMFVKFMRGDRKGSIARLAFEKNVIQMDPHVSEIYSTGRIYRLQGAYTYCVAVWSSPSRRSKVLIPSQDVVLLPNYKGKTVYQKFDSETAKKNILEALDERDIDGVKLNVGDRVLYINARYGSGSCLCHGVIKQFKVSASSEGHSVSTIVEEDETGITSVITSPSTFVWKKA